MMHQQQPTPSPMDDVLKRMLSTPPKPQKQDKELTDKSRLVLAQ